jgi:hypothetical protein
MASGMVSNPYAPAKEYVAQTTLCELCNITMKTRDWAAHKNSKKHRAAEKLENEKNNPPSNGFGDNTDGFNTVPMVVPASAAVRLVTPSATAPREALADRPATDAVKKVTRSATVPRAVAVRLASTAAMLGKSP